MYVNILLQAQVVGCHEVHGLCHHQEGRPRLKVISVLFEITVQYVNDAELNNAHSVEHYSSVL